MAYVRRKRVNEHVYYQLVRGYREDGKVKQEVLVHLGTHEAAEAALAEWEKRAARYRLFARMTGKEALAAKHIARAEHYEEKIRSLRAAL